MGECHCSWRAEQDRFVLVDPESYDPSEEQFSQSLVSARLADFCELPAANSVQNTASTNERGWRREVSQRVTRFRTRRGLPLPETAMSFDFEAASPEQAAHAKPPASVISAEGQTGEGARMEPKLIVFPRVGDTIVPQLLAAPAEELPPRIFEVEAADVQTPGPENTRGEPAQAESFYGLEAEYSPESSDSEAELQDDWNTSVAIAPMLPNFTLEQPGTVAAENAALAAELPLQMAPVGLRGLVVLLDGMVALLAAGLFTYVANYFGALPAEPKILLALEVLTIVFFWFAYQLLYLTFAARTLGMAIARLDLCTFEGYAVSRSRRQARAAGMLLSVLAVGLGYVWAFFDEDTLCWHDRITRTVLR
jgi:uncharacterized RDD family membrane protein YckC